MSLLRHEIVIAQPVERVFAAVADVTTHPKWQEGLFRTETVGGTPASVGARGVEVRRMFGREFRFSYEITIYAPPHAWGFRVVEGPVLLSAVLSFTSRDQGTLVQSELQIPGLLGPFVGRALLMQQRRNYARLKRMLEDRSL